MSLLKKIEDKKIQQRRKDRNKKVGIATFGIAAGAIAGAATGILLAPKSGKETRNDIKEKSIKAKETINDNIDVTKEKVNESKMKIKEYLESRRSQQNEGEIIEVEPLALVENIDAIDELEETEEV